MRPFVFMLAGSCLTPLPPQQFTQMHESLNAHPFHDHIIGNNVYGRPGEFAVSQAGPFNL
jgi:hypothetical protein